MGLNDWTLASRIRYASVWGGINAAVFLGLGLVLGSLSVQRALILAVPAALVAFLAQGWIWYPRAKKKLAARSR